MTIRISAFGLPFHIGMTYFHSLMCFAIGTRCNSDGGSVAHALQTIESDVVLDSHQKAGLTRFLSKLLAERGPARVLQVVSQAYQSLLENVDERASSHAVSVICSCLYLLKCLRRDRWRRSVATTSQPLRVYGHVRRILCRRVIVPERVVYIDREKYGCVLKQLQSSGSGTTGIDVVADEVGTVTLTIQGWREIPGHKPLLETAWAFMRRQQAPGFVARRSPGGFEFQMPLVERVNVSARGLHGVYVGGGRAEGIGSKEVRCGTSTPSRRRVLTALHEIKNRIIAYPMGWRDELTKYEGGNCRSDGRDARAGTRATGCEALQLIVARL